MNHLREWNENWKTVMDKEKYASKKVLKIIYMYSSNL